MVMFRPSRDRPAAVTAAWPAVAPSHPATAPELYSPGALFTWPELQAMASDGVLTQLYQRGYLPPGSRATPQLRARAAAVLIRPAIRQRVVAGRMTAAWIYRLRRRTGPARPARGRQPADFQPQVHAGLHVP